MSHVTMRELGKRLGVSAVTVSKALAGRSGVSEEMRQRIVRLADELGYVNPNAQAVRPESGLDVGILIPSNFFSSESFYALLYKELVQCLTEAGHFGLLELIPPEMRAGLVLPNLLRRRRVHALILLGQPEHAYLELLVRQPLPVICMDFFDMNITADMVVGDSAGGTALLTQHLIDQGHRDIAFYGEVNATSSIMERYLGYLSAMMCNGLPVPKDYRIADRDAHGTLIPLTLPQKHPTALVCNSDWSARWAIDQLRQQGLRVPEDISVVGYDDFDYTPPTVPALTTYRVNQVDMCRTAVRLIGERCAGDTKPCCRTVVGGKCIFRDSVQPLKKDSE